MINKWTVAKHDYYGWWALSFPELQVSELKLIVQEIIKVTNTEQVCKPSKVSDFDPIEQSYSDYFGKKVKERSRLDFFRTYNPSTLISYFDVNGKIVEGESLNIKDIVEKIGLDISMGSYPIPPVSFWGVHIPIDSDISTGYKSRLNISLKSDIWFPKVIGHDDKEHWYSMNEDERLKYFKQSPTFDNELAALHTPRFNRFLQKLRDITLHYGGKWSLEDPIRVPIWYQPYLTETGIKLTLEEE